MQVFDGKMEIWIVELLIAAVFYFLSLVASMYYKNRYHMKPNFGG